MNVAILLVIFVSGFIFTNNYPLARFKQLRATGWDSYSHIASWGLIFGAIGGTWVVVIDTLRIGSALFSWLNTYLPGIATTSILTPREALFVMWAVFSIIVAWITGCLLNTKACRKEAIIRLAAENGFELMLYDSAENLKPVLISLNSGKIYIGIVYRINNDDALGKTDYFSILPLWSGYRDKDLLSLCITTFYEDHYVLARAQGPMTNEGIFDQFKIVICSTDVSTLSYFDINVYHSLQPKKTKIQLPLSSTGARSSAT